MPKRGHRPRVRARPALVASGIVVFANPGELRLKLKLTRLGKRLLKHANHLKLVARGSFTPTGQAAVTSVKRFVIRR